MSALSVGILGCGKTERNNEQTVSYPQPVYEGEKRPTNMRVPSGDYTVSSTNLGAQVVSKKLNPGWNSPISMDGGGGSTDPNKDIEHPTYFAADLYLNNEKVATLDLTLQKGEAE